MISQLFEFLKTRFARNLAAFGTGTGIAQACMLIYAILLARYLSPDGYGLFAGAYAVATLTSFLFNWGLDTWLLRQGSLEKQSKQLTSSILATKAVFGVVWGIGLILILPIVQPKIYLASLVAVAALDVLFDGLFSAQVASLNVDHRFNHSSSLMVLSRGGRLLGAAILLLLGYRDPLVFALGRLAATTVGLLVIWFTYKPVFSAAIFHPLQNVRASFTYALSDLLSIIYLQVDVTILSLISGDKQQVGLYSPASGFVNALFVIPMAAYTVMLPSVTRLIEARSASIPGIVRKLFGGFFLIGAATWAAVWLLSRPLINLLLGAKYSLTASLIAILSPILLLKAIEFGCAVILVACGWQKRRIMPQILSAGLNIALNIAFIPLYCVWATAWVYLASELVLAIGYIWITGIWIRKRMPLLANPSAAT